MLMLIKVMVLLLMTTDVLGLYMYDDSIDHQGTEFLMMFLDSALINTPMYLLLTTPVSGPVSVTVETPLLTSVDRVDVTVQVFRHNTTLVPIPVSLRSKGTAKSVKSIWIKSEDVIIVYGSNNEQYSRDHFIVYPLKSLDSSYVATSIRSETNDSVVGVVATEDATVSFKLQENTNIEYNGGVFSTELNIDLVKYEVFQIQIADVTGIFINSNVTLAAFSGHIFLQTNLSGDHICVMLPPLYTLSLKYFVIPKPSYKIPELVRVVSTVPNTEVNIDDGTATQVILLSNAGSFHEFSLTSNSGVIITGDNKIQIAQISLAQSLGNYKGDQSMSLAMSPEDFLTEYTFIVPDEDTFSLVQSNLVIIYNKDATVKLDDVYLPNMTAGINIGDSDFIFTEIKGVSSGTHTLTGGDSRTRLAGILYGYGQYSQYQMTIGRSLGKLLEQVDASESALSDSCRDTKMIPRFTDYLPFETPSLNMTTVSKVQCSILCSENSTCYVLGIKSLEGSGCVECLLYTIAAASSQLRFALGYTLYGRMQNSL